MHPSHIAARLLLATALLLGGCATAPVVPTFDRDDPALAPGAEPRLVYRGLFTGPAELGLRPSAWERFVALLAGGERPRIVQPMAIAASGDGRLLYVADPGIGAVHRFDLARGSYRALRGPGGRALQSPVALALAPDGRVFVTDSARREVLSAGRDATRLEPLALGTAPGQPTGVAVDAAAGRLYVVDTTAAVVRIYGLDGASRGSFGRRGTAPGELNFPTYLWRAADGRLYVTDSMNFRVQWYEPDGAYVGGFGQAGDVTGTLSRPKGVATDRDGHVYVVDALHAALQVFDRDGRLLYALGQAGHGPGEFWLPSGAWLDGRDRVYVADTYNHRIQVFQYIGTPP